MVAQFLYDEAALLDEWRLDEWLALFHPEAAQYLIPSPGDLSDDPATTLHLVNDSKTTLAGRIGRLKSKHAHAESPLEVKHSADLPSDHVAPYPVAPVKSACMTSPRFKRTGRC